MVLDSKTCKVCGKEFTRYKEKRSLFLKKQTCSNYCRYQLASSKTTQTQFKKGLIPWNKGKQYSEERKQKMSEYMLMPNITFGFKKGNQLAKGNTSWLKGTKGLIGPNKGSFKKGQVSWIAGKKHREESKIKMSKARRNVIVPNKDTKPERMMHIWLTINGIKFEKHKPIKFNNRYHQIDIFIEPNICIEVDGDYWHANPNKYKPDDLIAGGRFAKDIWAEDIQENHALNNLGYFIIRLWESDIKKNIDSHAKEILHLVKPTKNMEVM